MPVTQAFLPVLRRPFSRPPPPSGSLLQAPRSLLPAPMSRFAFAPPPLHAARLLALFTLALAFASAASAQDDFLPGGPATNGSTDENQRFRAMPGAPGFYELAWWAREGRFYTPEKSVDLLSWESFPIIETGHDTAVSYAFSSDSPRVFVRLHHVASSPGDPYLADFDSDGLSNQQEFALKTNPFLADTDGDGMPDKWEVDHGLDPRDPADALLDADGDGFSNLEEYRAGLDPRADFYEGAVPLLTVVDGADQARRPGQFLPRPMRVRVTRADGTAWAGAPVRFSATADEGLLSTANTAEADLHAAITVRADADGYAQVWLKCP